MHTTMDSRIGLDFIVENPEYIRKLAAALDTNNITVKKQVFELLSALCVYNQEGHARALDTLDHYKKLKGERYRLSLIVKELDRATVVEYQTALVAFLNCLIISTPRLTDRTRLRNEFIDNKMNERVWLHQLPNPILCHLKVDMVPRIKLDVQLYRIPLSFGCHLLPVLNNLRKCAEAEPELAVQLDVFDEQRDSDDAQNLQGPHGVDLNSPLDVFYAILKQVAETPQEIPFLSILQHLLRTDPKEPVSDIIWDTAERLVHRATLLENREDAARLLRVPSVQSKFMCHCQHRSETSLSRKQSLSSTPLSPQPGPPPPPPLGPSFPPPPPPPPTIPAPPNHPPPAPRPPPPMQKSAVAISPTSESDAVVEKLPQQEIPAPKIKMKTINWNKIPNNKVVGKNNIWTQVAYSHQHLPMADMDWSEMEGLFCQQIPPSSAQPSPKLGGRDGTDTIERRMRKDNSEITLLDGKRSLNVNIFLKQFRSSNEDIVQLIREGEHDEIGAEKLKGLLKILPEVDELDMLKSFNGDYTKLGNAENFLLQLTNLPNYKLRIESMLLKEEFASNMGYLEPSINSMIIAAQDLMTNKPLQEVLYMILVAGNFLNSGGYAGNAAGVKLSSLQKITDIRANKPNMNLIHFVALQAEKRSPHLLAFTDNISVLEDAAKTTVEQLQNEINTLDVRIKKIKKQIDLPTTEMEIKLQMTEFLIMAEREVSNLQRDMGQLENVRRQLTDFFCEDINSFKLEECFRIFHGFYCKFKQAAAENARRRIQEEQANARRRQREELLATKRRQMGSLAGTSDSDRSFIDTQIYDARSEFPMKKGRKATNGNGASEEEISITGSPSITRRRLGSFNGQSGDNQNVTGREEKSPDITPNGSLRRRRSRVLSEEDEGNLMDFLRTSGHDNNRERKSWGSLDRSWARRARGSGPRKRPALLGADFGAERERPSSPSPLAETKPLFSTSEEESKPKEWRQKIESWLQANENDQVTDESRRHIRRVTNRRSLEMDSESERSSTLDTLPEGKQVYSGSQSTYRRVYPDWKPSTTIDKTDVMGAMEAVEEVQPQVKDKSAWRKSNLNVANSTEEAKDDSRFRHTLPRTSHSQNSSRMHVISEDSKDRKELISLLGECPPTDKLTLYIRNPEPPKPDPKSTLGYVPRPIRESQQSIDSETSNNKVEIDQDNIETPPATRRVFTPTPVDRREPSAPTRCSRLGRPSRDNLLSPEDPEVNTSLGDGQFDRFSAARRTRRYKRNTEPNETVTFPELVTETQVLKSNVLQAEKATLEQTPIIESPEVKEIRLKAWQDRLKTHGDSFEMKSTSTRRSRHHTGINQEEVKKALQMIPTEPIDIIGEKRRVTKTYINPDENKMELNKIELPAKKHKEHDNDEGFEETQSLMSESPSQGASSGGNYEPDVVDSPHVEITRPKPLRISSLECKGTIDSTSSETQILAPSSKSVISRLSKPMTNSHTSNLVQKYSRNFDRTNPTRHTTQEPNRKSIIPRRSDSLKRTESQSNTTVKRNSSIQKSNSRNSLVSSRSSLNSATSTNTVKRMPLKPTNTNVNGKRMARTPSVKTLTNTRPTTNIRRAPSTASTTTQKPPRPQGTSSFMKPTTSSSTKTNSPTINPSRLVQTYRSKN